MMAVVEVVGAAGQSVRWSVSKKLGTLTLVELLDVCEAEVRGAAEWYGARGRRMAD